MEELSRAHPTLKGENVVTTSNEFFRIINLNVGQGDAALLISPDGETALIDTGPPEVGATRIAAVLRDQGIDRLETIFISHDHLDHRGSLEALLQLPLGKEATVIDNSNLPLGQTLQIGKTDITVLAGSGVIGDKRLDLEEQRDKNAWSHALLIGFRQFHYFTNGDLPGGGGNPPYQTVDLETPLLPLLTDIDVLKVSHHGSHTATFLPLLEALTPEAAIISVGNENEFFHPHPSLIDRLLQSGITVYQTERGWLYGADAATVNIFEDHICIVTDGTRYKIKPYAVDKCAPKI